MAYQSSPYVDPGPFSHRQYTGHVVTKGLLLGQVPIVHVQIKRKGTTHCGTVAQIVELFNSDGREWFKVDCDLGRVWVEHRNVRLCSGDGYCSCAKTREQAVAAATQERTVPQAPKSGDVLVTRHQLANFGQNLMLGT